VLVGLSYVSVIRGVPLALREARVNSVTRVAFEQSLAKELLHAPRSATFMMYTGDHVGALQTAGVHLQRVVNENNYDLWRDGLKAPANAADYVVAVDGDPVSAAVQAHKENLRAVLVLHTMGKPRAVIYQSDSKKSPH
jgi:hypothetical protein